MLIEGVVVMFGEFIFIFFVFFVIFFVLIDVLGVVLVFVLLIVCGFVLYWWFMVVCLVLVGMLIIFGFVFFGVWLFDKLYIIIDVFCVVGGILFFIIVLDMVFEKCIECCGNWVEVVLVDLDEIIEELEDVFVFLFGILMLVGLGLIVIVMFYML